MFIDDAYAHLYSLSRKGLGVSTPNPNVSAAIYGADQKLIADGFHNRTNSVDHAEVIALKKAGAASRGATLVVSLNHVRIKEQRRPAPKQSLMQELPKLFTQSLIQIHLLREAPRNSLMQESL